MTDCMYRLLDKIESPADIKGLDIDGLRELCAEIRQYIVECCSVNPGHVASSLGAVELIVGMHYVYDAPADRFVFDVGHQAYAHKILTGRKEAFKGNRKKGGISGFPVMAESIYDAFGTGHSSTSISAAMGLAEAAKIQGRGDKVIALIGDGALTGGLAFEGMNNAGAGKSDILVILNDNDQSIDRNLGGMHDYLLKITTSAKYNTVKERIWDRLGEGKLRKRLQKMTRDAKANLVRRWGGNLFEDMGFRYFGPIDGNDIAQVVDTLQRLKRLGGPRLLHAHTLKGKGFTPAEDNPTVWHAPGKYDPETGERIKSPGGPDRYQDVFGQTLCDLAEADSRVIGITPAMAQGSGMCGFKDRFPDRFYDVGIAEEHAVTFSAGLAAGGLRPFCSIYSSFSQRAYDQIVHDVALQKLPVTICLDRAGLVGEDGATHQGAFDMAAFRSIPNTIICSPRNEAELRRMMSTALSSGSGPFIIRWPRGCGEGVRWKDIPVSETIEAGKGEKLKEGSDISVLALGPVVNRAMEAAAKFERERGIHINIYDMKWLKPLDTSIVDEAAACRAILTVEDGAMKGGLYGAVCEYLASSGKEVRVKGLGIPDTFIKQDTQAGQRAFCGIDSSGIYDALGELLENLKK